MNACIFFPLISEEMICTSSRLKSKQPYALTKKNRTQIPRKFLKKNVLQNMYLCVCSQECQKIGAKKILD